jgi:hypothetical protein
MGTIQVSYRWLMLVFAVFPLNLWAGMIEQRTVLWVNLDRDKSAYVDKAVISIVEDNSEERSVPFHIYMNKRPVQITNELVEMALIKNDAGALSRLKKALVEYRDEERSGPRGDSQKGLDGIIVYSSKPTPRLIRLTTPRNYSKKVTYLEVKQPFNMKSFTDQFYDSLPPITRLP